ncbi:MAG: cold-shock protein [Phycisphaerales bacterium]
MPEGTVVKYNEKTGTGLVRPDDGAKDIFLHRDYLKMKGEKGLAVDQRIRFVIGRGYRGPKAKDIEVL